MDELEAEQDKLPHAEGFVLGPPRAVRGRRPRVPVVPPKQINLAAAGESQHTEAAYQSGLRHFTHAFGRMLPASVGDVVDYLYTYQVTVSPKTLSQRLWALGRFHREYGFPDPTVDLQVAKTLKGTYAEYNTASTKARPLLLTDLYNAIGALDQHLVAAQAISNPKRSAAVTKTLRRDKAILLLGFWLGFRSDELARVKIEHITYDRTGAKRALEVFLPKSKGDRRAGGRQWRIPELPLLCPVSAYLDWIHAAQLTEGAAFRKVTSEGTVWEKGLNPASLTGVLQRALTKAGLEGDTYTSHSLRRGLAVTCYEYGGTLDGLTRWVKWADPKTALGYQDGAGEALPEMILHTLAKRTGADEQGAAVRLEAANTP